ncbi:MAG: hypothetical protein IPK60_04995 [Sandaracinaceae bacterium]|nr:hypothetical protein [Sandaracinaceae bacterium]
MRIVLLLTLISLIGCGSTTPAAQTAETADGNEPELVVGGPPNIRLLEDGAEPRAPLRYRFTAGNVARSQLEMHMTMALSIEGQELPMPSLPASRIGVKIEILTVDPQGNAHVGYTIESMQIVDPDQHDPNVVAAIQDQYTRLEHIAGSMDVDTRGVCTNTQFNLPADADEAIRMILDDMRKSMPQITTVLPEEPVGLGARWEAHAKVNLRGIDVDQVSTFVLNERDADTASMHILVEQHARNAAMNLPNLPEGAEALVDSLESNGSGDVVLSFVTLSPTSDVTMHANMSAHITSGDQTQAMGMRLEMVARFFPVEP